MQNNAQQNILCIFTDAATSPQKEIAVGAFLCIKKIDINTSSNISKNISYNEYKSKKSTWSEIKTIINALKYTKKTYPECTTIHLYTDCQSACDLLGDRKHKLLKNNFK